MAEKVPATADQWFMAWCKVHMEGSTHPFWRGVVATGEFDPDHLERLIAAQREQWSSGRDQWLDEERGGAT